MSVPALNTGSDFNSDFQTESQNQKFAQRLKEKRKKYDFTQKKLASMINVDVNTVQKWEAGSLPKGDYAIRLAKKLECSLDWLLTGRGEELVIKEDQAEYTKKPEAREKTTGNSMTDDDKRFYQERIRFLEERILRLERELDRFKEREDPMEDHDDVLVTG